MDLNTPIRACGRMYKMYAGRLEKLGIKKIEDFLLHIPFRYEDYSLVSKISNVQPGEIITIKGEVIEMKNEYTRYRKTIQKAKVRDETGEINIIWFNQPFLTRTITQGKKISISGKVKPNFSKLLMESPDYEIFTNNNEIIHTGRLVPVYPETKGVSSKWLRRQIYKIIKNDKQNLFEYLPSSLIKNHDLMGFIEALEQIHFPKTLDNLD